MKNLKLKVLSTIVGLSVLASNASAGSLGSVELGSDFNSSCEKFKEYLMKKEPNAKFTKTDEKCGYQWVRFIGLETKDGKTVDYIGVKAEHFGFDTLSEAKDVANAYLQSEISITYELEYNAEKFRYVGYNLLKTEQIWIDQYHIQLNSINKKSSKASSFE